eukprot:COSAG01_NODE_2261_length_8057_cov_38.489570_3_plen_52_part_00
MALALEESTLRAVDISAFLGTHARERLACAAKPTRSRCSRATDVAASMFKL